ncbi:MAG: hypothetical protein COV01_01215 [Candidatus Taylorbacteria bacterium CG10_big_fil_rev_8_21_14_0_10_41_48]|uniref:Solute-binding protein family 5 domain-containing protein n=1 Tax=Candidatus Taylorbacteria bacterium CG10_big_fil_rev_8_21_14_0_10_41_48 TaxID=1975024 RepID=A0A2M8LCQ0_9BACT|nr:MAG: hypothetical protein COV01_01215 [Candidatus Taylorbacteria bacterium CG10_big_fil_rev_8_21_14_0_10_41_48]
MPISDDQHYIDNDIENAERDQLWNKLTESRRPKILAHIDAILPRFSPSERFLLYALSILLAVGTAFLLVSLNKETTVETPKNGGTLTEGLVGTPRFINPVLAISDTDRDLTALIYSGLMRPTPEGDIVPDLAKSFSISDDGLTYTFILRDDITFHDNTPVTSADVSFTVRLAQTPDIKSPKRADWEGVRVEEVDEKTIQFTLARPYAPFIENTTIGILPMHLWKDVSPDEFPFFSLNTRPIGSGPYQLDSMQSDGAGLARRYTLKAFKNFSLGRPLLNSIRLLFYTNEESLISALKNGSIEGAPGISPSDFSIIDVKNVSVVETTLPRTFAVFLNQNKAGIFSDNAVRAALDVSLDKKSIIDEVLGGFGVPLNGPIPPGVLVTSDRNGNIVEKDLEITKNDRLEIAAEILNKAGWERNEESGIWEKDGAPLSFSIKTASTPELALTAEKVVETWGALGAEVSLEIFATNDLNTSVIRPREYQALLFGEIVGRTLDLFAFWHSSQRSDPGLNLAIYTNSDADKLLSEARIETERDIREDKYAEFGEIVVEDIPAIFLYAPKFIYVVPDNLKGIRLGALTTPAERFLNVHEWHTETERVWNIFQ